MANAGCLVNGAWMPAVDANGYPIFDAYLRVYTNRTTTLAPIFADQALTVPLPNPIDADSSGQFPPIWQDSALFFSMEFGSTSTGPIGTVDDLQPSTNIGGASDKLDRDGGNPAPDLLENIGAVSKELRNATYVHLLDVVPQSLWAALQSPASSPTDMTTYILAAAAKLPKGGVVRADGGLFLRLRTQCVLPTGVSLWAGDDAPDEPVPLSVGDYTVVGSQLLYDEETDYGPFGVVLRVGLGASGYSGFTVRPYTFTPRYETKAEFLAAKTAHFGKTFSNHVGPGGRVHHNLYLGCNIGHDAFNIERPYVDNNRGDCNTLIRAQTITDWGGLANNHKWPFSCAHQPWSDPETYYRPGPSHTLYDVADWTQQFRAMSFAGREGMHIRNSDNTTHTLFGHDGPAPDARLTAGTLDAWFDAHPCTGIKYTGAIRRALASDGMISSQTFGVEVDISWDGLDPNLYGTKYADDVHLSGVRIGASRDYAYQLTRGNFTSVGGHSYVHPLVGVIYTHIKLEDAFGQASFVGHTFENGTDIFASSLSLAREVQSVGNRYKSMTQQSLYSQQLQGALYVRGDDTARAGKNQAAVILENRTASTGTSTGQAWSWVVGDDGAMRLVDVSDSEAVLKFDPATSAITSYAGRFFGTATVGNDFWFGVDGGSEPTNLAFGIHISSTGVVSDTLVNGASGVRSVVDETIGWDIAGTTYTVVTADYGLKRRTANVAATTITLPATARPGSWVDFIQGSVGQITFAPASGATVVGYPGVKSAGLYATVRATCHSNAGSAAAWYISGAAAA